MSATRWRILSIIFIALGSLAAGRVAAQEVVRTLVTGRVIAAGGGDVRGVRVLARAGELADSTEADSTGHFAVALAAPFVADSVELWVGAGDSAAYHPARVRLGAAEASREQAIVLVPLRWRIRAGRFAGQEVDVRLARAFAPPCASCSGFYRALRVAGDSGRTGLQGWPAERFPLRVAFDREWNGERVTAGDSAAFWREAGELEDALGADLFRPATYADAVPREEGGPDDAILVWFDPDMKGIGGIGTAVSNGADIGYGDLRLNRRALLEEASAPGLVSHELMHTLGFGHTCAWRSVVADVRRCPWLRAPAATEEDVAYAELAAEIRALLRSHPHRWGLEAALAAMEAPSAGRPLATRED